MSETIDTRLKGAEPRSYQPPGQRQHGEEDVAVELARLSSEVGHMAKSLEAAAKRLDEMAHPETGLYARLTRIESKLQHVPTEWGVAKIVGTLLVVVAALTALLGPPLQRMIWGERAPATAPPPVGSGDASKGAS